MYLFIGYLFVCFVRSAILTPKPNFKMFQSIFPALPKYPGPYQVGTIDIEIPLSESGKFDVTGTFVETVLVRLFYPAESIGATMKVPTYPSWLPQQSMEYAKGYANFFKLQPILPASLALNLALYYTVIPAMENVPPITPPKSRLPVMIFSHGLGGSRNTYSQWCGSVASYGVFVAAIEHRDGSAPVSIVNAGRRNQYSVPYRRITEYSDLTKDYRTSQLAQRTFEVSKLVTLLRDINHGRLIDISDDKKPVLDMFKGLLNTKKGQLIMAGHSFGAATTVSVCRDKENVETDHPLSGEFKAALLLDIWAMVKKPFP